MSGGPVTGASWYDLLGVDHDAKPAQIKAAWRDATDRFEPGSGTSQFRLFNEAADVLLDPARRAAYDEQIGVAAPTEEPPSVTLTKPAAAPAAPPSGPTTHWVRQAVAVDAASTGKGRRSRTARAPARVPAWLLALLTILVLAVVAVGGIFAVRNHDDGQENDAGQEASAAAERALPAILSYDYRRLKADRTRADAFLTPAYRKEYNTTFDKLIESNGSPGPATQAKAVVKATVQNVGVVAAQPGRVRVIAFVNQTTTKGSATPTLALNRLTVSMRKSGNAWLVENITSY